MTEQTITRRGAEEAVTDIINAFFDAIDDEIDDADLAKRVKATANRNILRSILKTLLGDDPTLIDEFVASDYDAI